MRRAMNVIRDDRQDHQQQGQDQGDIDFRRAAARDPQQLDGGDDQIQQNQPIDDRDQGEDLLNRGGRLALLGVLSPPRDAGPGTLPGSTATGPQDGDGQRLRVLRPHAGLQDVGQSGACWFGHSEPTLPIATAPSPGRRRGDGAVPALARTINSGHNGPSPSAPHASSPADRHRPAGDASGGGGGGPAPLGRWGRFRGLDPLDHSAGDPAQHRHRGALPHPRALARCPAQCPCSATPPN